MLNKRFNFIRTSSRSVRQKDILLATGVSQTAVRTILADLIEQHLIERDTREPFYTATNRLQKVDFSGYDSVLQQKREELSDITNYATSLRCYAEYLTTFLGDQPGYNCGVCGRCRPDLFPLIIPSQRIQQAVTQFLEKDFLPRIQKKGPKHVQFMNLVGHCLIMEVAVLGH